MTFSSFSRTSYGFFFCLAVQLNKRSSAPHPDAVCVLKGGYEPNIDPQTPNPKPRYATSQR
jgi:hypothetical protein